MTSTISSAGASTISAFFAGSRRSIMESRARALVNRVDPVTFGRCFDDWIRALWPGRHDLIAIDGKTSRRTGDERKGLKALHTLSAYATNAHLTLAQLSVPEKTNEITAIPVVLYQLAETGQLEGALVTIDAMGCHGEIAARIVEHKADFLLPLKGNQPTLEAEVAAYFETATKEELVTKTTVEKGHGRIETRVYTASKTVDWIESDRSYPGKPRFAGIRTLLRVVNKTEYADRCTFDTRLYISSAPLDIERLAAGARGHWGVESMHWLLDVEFKDDLSRYRAGHGAKNMAVVRRFVLSLLRFPARREWPLLAHNSAIRGICLKVRNIIDSGPLSSDRCDREVSDRCQEKPRPGVGRKAPGHRAPRVGRLYVRSI